MRTKRHELDRLLERTKLGPVHPTLGACWTWHGVRNRDGYGRMGKAQDPYTHRLGYKLIVGPIPADREIHHRCRNRACWNPAHLELVTHATNMQLTYRATCWRGHPMSGDNLYVFPDGRRRHCRACNTERQRAFQERRRRVGDAIPHSVRYDNQRLRNHAGPSEEIG